MQIGDKVKYSGYVINEARDRWNRAGDYRRKNDAKYAMEEKAAARGTIIDIKSNSCCKEILVIKWDDGHTSEGMSYLVEVE